MRKLCVRDCVPLCVSAGEYGARYNGLMCVHMCLFCVCAWMDIHVDCSYAYMFLYVCLYVCNSAAFSTLIGERSTFLPSSLFCVGFDTSKQ